MNEDETKAKILPTLCKIEEIIDKSKLDYQEINLLLNTYLMRNIFDRSDKSLLKFNLLGLDNIGKLTAMLAMMSGSWDEFKGEFSQ